MDEERLVVLEEAEPACSSGARTPQATPGAAIRPNPAVANNRPGLAASAASERVCPRTSRSPRAWGPGSPASSRKRPFRLALLAHRDPPGGVRAPRFRVELVQAVGAPVFGALYLFVQNPVAAAHGRRQQPGLGSAQTPAQASGGRHVRLAGPLPVCSSSRGPPARASLGTLVPLGLERLRSAGIEQNAQRCPHEKPVRGFLGSGA